MKIMSPEKKLAKSWPFGEMKTRNTLLDKRFRVSGYHSHSILAGGLVVTSRTTRLAWGTSLTMRAETRAMRS